MWDLFVTLKDIVNQSLPLIVLDCLLLQAIGRLSALTELDVSDNKLEHLPDEIGGLVSLTDLHLSVNHIDHLPDSIG